MSIVRETLDNGLVRTHSNAGVKIHGGFPEGDYNVVYDPEEADRTYVETNIPIDEEDPQSKPAQYSKVKILLAAQNAGFIDSLIGFIESDRRIEYIWNASNTIEDNELLSSYMEGIASALGKTEAEVKEFLNEYCVAD